VKRLILAGTLLIFLAMALSPMAGAYTASDRETVSVVGGNMQFSYIVPGVLAYDYNLSLPFPIGDFHVNETKLVFDFTGYVNFSSGSFWNGRIWGAGAYEPGDSITETLWIAMHQGGVDEIDPADTWSHINITANSTAWNMTVTFYLDDVDDINSFITYGETDLEDPQLDGAWSVNDTLTFALPYDFDVNLQLEYPDTAKVTGLDYYPWNGTTVSDTDVLYVNYDKYGAFHDIDEDDVDITKGTNTVTVEFDSEDKLKDATWDIDPTDEIWDGAFAGLDYDKLVIEVNGEDFDDWEEGSIVMENLDIDDDTNEFVFTWAGTAVPPPTEEPVPDVWTQEAITGVPNWALLAIAVIVVIAVVAIWKNEKK
jgi:hypothetical protein